MNNNPFSCNGEISRISFIITTLVLTVPFSICISLQNMFSKHGGSLEGIYICFAVEIFITLLAIFACAKRLRNAGKNPYLSILFALPIVCLVMWFYLVIKQPVNK